MAEKRVNRNIDTWEKHLKAAETLISKVRDSIEGPKQMLIAELIRTDRRVGQVIDDAIEGTTNYRPRVLASSIDHLLRVLEVGRREIANKWGKVCNIHTSSIVSMSPKVLARFLASIEGYKINWNESTIELVTPPIIVEDRGLIVNFGKYVLFIEWACHILHVRQAEGEPKRNSAGCIHPYVSPTEHFCPGDFSKGGGLAFEASLAAMDIITLYDTVVNTLKTPGGRGYQRFEAFREGVRCCACKQWVDSDLIDELMVICTKCGKLVHNKSMCLSSDCPSVTECKTCLAEKEDLVGERRELGIVCKDCGSQGGIFCVCSTCGKKVCSHHTVYCLDCRNALEPRGYCMECMHMCINCRSMVCNTHWNIQTKVCVLCTRNVATRSGNRIELIS